VKRSVVIFGIQVLCLLVALPSFSQNNLNKIDRVVIDAGHGGHDPGAMGKHSREKDIVLSIALKTGEYIEKNMKDVQVIYTRKKDEFIELYRRAQIANENHADLFISIHCNSNPKSHPYGAETYVMGLHKSEDNLEVAKLENAPILLESDYSARYEGFDPNSDEAYIVFNLYQNIFIDQSLSMAVKVQEQFRERVGRHDRGVKQAGFMVLYKTTMPGILVETGFLSNPEEEKFLLSELGQVYLASAIYRAFRDYKKEFEGDIKGTYTTYETYSANEPAKPVKTSSNEPSESKQSYGNNNPGAPKQDQVQSKDTPPEKDQAVLFRVQFFSSSVRIPLDSPKFKGIQGVREYAHGGLYKYTTGNEMTFVAASQLCTQIRKNGFVDAFVVAFQNEVRIDINKAKELSGSGK
jgi:N-acetylmuramoyl-L-alanine amidase